MQRIETLERYGSIAAIAVCLVALAVTGMVLFGHTPLLFNSGIRLNHLLTIVSFLALLALVSILGLSFANAHARALRRPILLGLVVLGTIEMALPAFDRLLVSAPSSTVSAALYTVRLPGGEFYLEQPNATSPFGFRSPVAEPKRFAGRRILMLGSSYVEGSGTTFATNYPQVLERVLNDGSGTPVSVMSAGVKGFGLVEDRLLYEYLVAQGYSFDAVILNFYLGGDQTNDIPGTTRTAIAGRAQRLHKNFLLRHFYPLNTNLYRFALAIRAASGDGWGTEKAMAQDATCTPSAAFAAFSRERATTNYSPAAKQAIDMAFNRDEIHAIARDAARNGARFGVVLLPDYGALLPVNRNYFAPGTMDWNWIRTYLADNIATTYPVLDLSREFLNRPEYFRCNDTHWNDRGNVKGAQVVGQFARQLVLQ